MRALIALGCAFALIAVAIALGGDFIGFWDVASFVLVVLGTIAITAIGLRRGDLAIIRTSFPGVLSGRGIAPERVAALMIDLAKRLRQDGPAALDTAARNPTIAPSLARGLMLLNDGLAAEVVDRVLRAEADLSLKRQLRLADLSRRAADIAPAMGLIGTLVGLVQMLGTLSTPEAIGPAMAIALLTTLYGAILAHVVFLPLAHRAEDQAEAEYLTSQMCATGVLALARRDHPLQVESQLNALLPTHPARAA